MEDKVIKCEICHRTLKNSHNLARHMKNIHGTTATKYQCSICNKTLSRRDVLNRHTMNIHGIQETKFKKTEIKQKLQKTIMTIALPDTTTRIQNESTPSTLYTIQKNTKIQGTHHWQSYTDRFWTQGTHPTHRSDDWRLNGRPSTISIAVQFRFHHLFGQRDQPTIINEHYLLNF